MSSYASYCQDQAADCALRARLTSSPEIVAYCRSLELRWLKLAAQAQETGVACARMPMTMSGSPREPKNEQQVAGHNQNSCSKLFPRPLGLRLLSSVSAWRSR